MDSFDTKAFVKLTVDGRITWADLASRLGLSAPAVAERGVIKGFAAIVDPLAVGYNLTAFMAVPLSRPQDRAPFLGVVGSLAEVQECHHVAVDDDCLLKIRCRAHATPRPPDTQPPQEP